MRCSNHLLPLCLVHCLIVAVHGAADPSDTNGHAVNIPISVEEPANVGRKAAPVSGGIPIPRGLITDSSLKALKLVDRRGKPVSSFQEPVVLGRWDDGSARWLLLNFLADVRANGSSEFVLKSGAPSKVQRNSIKVHETAEAFTVDTGKLKAVINKQQFTFLEQIWVDANGDGRYSDAEQVVDGPGEMFIDLDLEPPGPADSGVRNYPDTWHFGMEGGNWLRKSQSAASERYRASAGDYSVSLFRSGTTETIFKAEGWHRSEKGRQFGKYSLYMYFHADQDTIRVAHTWIMTGDPDKNFIRRMAIEVPVGFPGESLDYAFGGPYEHSGKPHVLNPSIDSIPYIPVERRTSEIISGSLERSGQAHLVSIGPDKYYHNVPADHDLRVEFEVVVDGTSREQGYHPAGWASISNGSLGMAMGVRDFWREHPKEVQYKDGTMAVYLWPDHGDRSLDLRRRYPEVRGEGPKRGGSFGKAARREFVEAGSAVGLAKTTDLFFRFHSGDHRTAEIDDSFRSFQDPLRPFADPAWNCATGVFGPLLPYDPKGFSRIENYVDLSFAWPLRSAQEFNWYGMLDYGDHLMEYESINWELSVPSNPGVFQNWGYSGWMQEAYRTGQWMFIQYLRSGRSRYFREADNWLRHHRDVDCSFWDTPDDGPRPNDNKGGDRLGGGHRHDQQHWGAYLTSYGIPSIAVAHHYFLTGDGRDLDAMRKYCPWLLHKSSIENQGLLSVLYMADALGDQDLIDEALLRQVKPGVGFGRLIFDSGMALMLHDIRSNGSVRERLKEWADIDDPSATFIRAYLYSRGETQYQERLHKDFEDLFPAKRVRSQFFAWASRKPSDFRDAFSADIMPDGVWTLPFRTLEKLVFDAPHGMGNNTSRNQLVSQLLWLMPIAEGEYRR